MSSVTPILNRIRHETCQILSEIVKIENFVLFWRHYRGIIERYCRRKEIDYMRENNTSTTINSWHTKEQVHALNSKVLSRKEA